MVWGRTVAMSLTVYHKFNRHRAKPDDRPQEFFARMTVGLDFILAHPSEPASQGLRTIPLDL
jgi:hypothetical protein